MFLYAPTVKYVLQEATKLYYDVPLYIKYLASISNDEKLNMIMSNEPR